MGGRYLIYRKNCISNYLQPLSYVAWLETEIIQ